MLENNYTPNKRTENIINLMLEMIDTAQQAGKKLVIGSGLGLDIEAASIRADHLLTRDHGDLDIYPLEADIPFWKKWFTNKHYLVTGNDEIKDPSKAFVAFPPTFNEDLWETDPDSYYIDAYSIMLDEKGIIHMRVTGKDENWKSTWEENFLDCSWRGRKITIARHEKVLLGKRNTAKSMGTELREKDLHDHALFNIDPSNP